MTQNQGAHLAVVDLADAEREHPHPLNPNAARPYVEVLVGEWTLVRLNRTESPGVVAVVTPTGLACDCGKAVLCPANPQFSLDRPPYVGTGLDGLDRSINIDLEEADIHPLGSPAWERAQASALAWGLQRSLVVGTTKP